MKAGIIRLDMDDQVDPVDEDKRFIFCKKHQTEGIKVLQTQGSKGLEADLEPEIEEDQEIVEKRRREKLNKKLEDLKREAMNAPKPAKLPPKLPFPSKLFSNPHESSPEIEIKETKDLEIKKTDTDPVLNINN